MRHDCLEPLGLTVTEAARRLDVSRKQLSELVNGRKAERAARGDEGVRGEVLEDLPDLLLYPINLLADFPRLGLED